MNFLKNLKMKYKLIFSFIFMIVMTLVVSSIAIQSLNSNLVIADNVHQLVDVRYNRLAQSSAIASQLNNDIANYLSPGRQTSENLKVVQDTINKAQESVMALDINYNREIIGTLQEETKKYISDFQTIIVPLVEAGKPFDALAYYLSDMQPLASTITDQYTAFTKEFMKSVGNNVAQLRDTSAIYVVVVVTIIALIFGISLSLLISNYITRKINEQVDVAKAIAHNDLSVAINNDSNDELGELAHAINDMRRDLSESISMIINVANDLSNNLETVNQDSTNIENKAKIVEDQAITVAAASDEMVSTTQDIAKNCENAAAASEQTRRTTNESMDVVRLTVQDIKEQNLSIQDNAQKIQTLADQSQKIGSIVSTIEDIAAQTNLLALNAAIEAARAGEAGRGFAVVADEVRALASRTTKSTQEISQMVSQIQNDANVATQSMGTSVENMDRVANKASDLENMLNRVLDDVNAANSQITQIATAAEEQTTATSEISSNMQHITDQTKDVYKNAHSSMETVEATIGSLRDLLQSLSRFKLC